MSRVAVIGTGYVGLTTGACLAHLGHEVVCADVDEAKVDLLQAGARSRSSRTASRSWCARGSTAGRLSFVVGGRAAAARRRVRLPVRADAPGRRRLGRPVLRRAGARPRSARCWPRAASSSTSRRCRSAPTRVVERALGRERRRRGLQPRVPPRGLGRPRLPQPRPHRHRQRRPGRRRPGGRASTSGIAGPAARHRPGVRGDDQVRLATPSWPPRSRFINAIANLCEAVGRRRARRRPRHGLRQAHRLRVPPARARVGAAAAFPRTPGRWCSIAEDAGYDFGLLKGVIDVNDEQFERVVDKIEPAGRAASLDGRHRGGVGPDVQGRHRRPAGLAGARRDRRLVVGRAPGCRPSTRPVRRSLPPGIDGSPASRCAPTPTPPARAPSARRGPDRVGRVPLARLRQGRRTCMAHPAIVDARNLLDPAPLRRRGFAYEGMGRSVSRIVVAGGAGFLGSAPVPGAARPGRRGRRVDNLVTGASDNWPSFRGPGRRSRSSTRTSAGAVPVDGPIDAVMNLASPASPRDFASHSPRDPGGRQPGTEQLLDWPGPREPGSSWPRPARSTAIPLVHPQPETYWGNVNPIGPRRSTTRPSASPRRLTMAYHRQLRPRRPHRPHLQHLRAADAPRRRAGGVQLHRPGAAGRAAHRLRRRHPDPQLLLRRRRGRRLPRPARLGLRRARSTSATPTSSPCSSWPSWSWRSPARRRR